ncbi:DUF5719 family protein [Leifsonia poae]|uniref:DUF5719 family protein n=1 Tax=Leifsonia poae TaxID=110933 RepID=UPI001CBC9A60|nr:DUF5719 family protein [Leifsonia poae]
MADKRGIARVSIRALTGVIGVGVAVVAVAGATFLPLPSFQIAAPVSTVKPVPADQQRVCPGPLLALGADAGDANAPSAFAGADTTDGTDGPSVQTRRLKSDSTATDSYWAPEVLTVPTPSGASTPPLVAGSQLQLAQTPDLAGLAAASCDEASADSWLVAGSTSLGQTSLVLLSNPTSVQATVTLTIYSEAGAVDAPGAIGIVVPAGAQKVIPLAGLAPSAAAPVVHVQSTGGQVLASLQQSFEQGIDPRGVELTGATAAPERTQVISGMTIATLAKVEAGQSGEGYGTDLPAVRVFVPGDQDSSVTVGAVGENGTAAGNAYSATVKAGVVTEIPLDGLKDGNYTVTVRSTHPIVAAARTSVIGAKARDFAWFVSSPPMADDFLVAVTPGPGPLLHFANTGEKNVKVTLTDENGTSSTLAVPAEGSANRSVAAGIVTVSGADGMVVSVSYAADGRSSSFALSPPGPLAAPIEVYPR